MEKKEEITYLFGAGASYYSMPMVNNFAKRFNVFLTYLEGHHRHEAELIAACRGFKEQLGHHLSFDTFFKKLFHLNGSGVYRYKKILLIFFLFEALFDPKFFPEINNEKECGIKKGSIDPRYEALIAGLLHPRRDSFSLVAKVNFLTWNYDLNIITSIKNFFTNQLNLNEFIERYKRDFNSFWVENDIKVIHINGRVYHPNFIRENIYFGSDLHTESGKLFKEFSNESSYLGRFAELMKFSWESLSENNGISQMPEHIEMAKEAIISSNSVVVIGYSFPLYNRFVDSYLFHQDILGGKRIYIQDPYANEVKEILNNDFDLFISDNFENTGKKPVILKAIENCNSFFVPSNLYVPRYSPTAVIK